MAFSNWLNLVFLLKSKKIVLKHNQGLNVEKKTSFKALKKFFHKKVILI